MMKIGKKLLLGTAMLALTGLAGCATVTNDANVPIELSFSNGASGECTLTNKRVTLQVKIPSTPQVRRSDDALKYDCVIEDGKTATGQIESSIGGKIIASAILLDYGITDAITDKHREYPVKFVIPVLAE